MAKTQSVVHQNYLDNNGKIYCRKLHKIVEPDSKECDTCPYFFGSLQGEGVECRWEDNQEFGITSVDNASKELLRVSKLMDEKKIPR